MVELRANPGIEAGCLIGRRLGFTKVYEVSPGKLALQWIERGVLYADCCVEFLTGPAARIAVFLDTLEGKGSVRARCYDYGSDLRRCEL